VIFYLFGGMKHFITSKNLINMVNNIMHQNKVIYQLCLFINQ